MKYLIILLSLFIVGCSNLSKERVYYSNGNLKSEISTDNNSVKNGPILNYFEDGRVAVKGYFKDDKRDKKWYFYDENTGNISAIETYKDGELEGEQLYYYPNGKLKLKGSYKDNIRIGF